MERSETEEVGKRCESDTCERGSVGQETGRLKGKSRDEGRASRAFIGHKRHKRHKRHRKDGGCPREMDRGRASRVERRALEKSLIFQWIVQFNPGKALEIGIVGPNACPLFQRVSSDQCIG